MQKINSEKETIVVTLKNIIKKINLPVIDIFKTKYLEGLKNFYNNTERPEVEGFKEFLENYIKEDTDKDPKEVVIDEVIGQSIPLYLYEISHGITKNYKKKKIKNISKLCDVRENQINIKGKTTEKLGVIGKTKAIACEVIASVIKYD